MTSQITEQHGLEGVIDTRFIESIHETVVNALEKDLYRANVGRFKVNNASGEFHVGNFTEGRRVLIQPETIQRYDLLLDLEGDEVPGDNKGAEYVGVGYSKEVRNRQIHRHFEVAVKFPRKPGESGTGALSLYGFDLLNRKVSYWKPERGNITPETLLWIHDQLRVDAKH